MQRCNFLLFPFLTRMNDVFVMRLWQRPLHCVIFIHPAFHLLGFLLILLLRGVLKSPQIEEEDINRLCRKLYLCFFFFFTNSYKYTQYSNKNHCCYVMMMQLSKRSTDKYTHATNETDCKKEQQNSWSEGKRTECCVLLSWDSLKSFRRGRLSVQVKDLITALTPKKRVEMGNSREVWQARHLTQPCGGTRGGQPHSQWSWRVWMNASRGTWGNRGSKRETGNWKNPLYRI